MTRISWLDVSGEDGVPEVLWEDGERRFCTVRSASSDDVRQQRLAVLPASAHPTAVLIRRFKHEYALRDYLDGAWALRPVELACERGQTMLVVEYAGGRPLTELIGQPMEVGLFLRLALATCVALGKLHGRGVVHKDIKPAHVLVEPAAGLAWLTGFGIASSLPRERQAPEPPEFITGTLAYMAPEQTGRVNRSIDSRSDLYSLGITFYEMLTGTLPFAAADTMEWVHCHIARQPEAARERQRSVPAQLSAVVGKLLSKTVDERYQTVSGLERDLRRCLAGWNGQGHIADFVPGEHDTSDRLLIPEKLYGRDREIDALLGAFQRVVAGGRAELVVVSGYSGIGKSAVVNELHKAFVPARGLFASGKFEQYKRDIPYATLAQAFQSLIRSLLSKAEEELREWREALTEALGPNGQLVVDLVPDLKHIIGEQPPVVELPPQHAQGRFQLVFRRFIGVFARPEHPLALFLDDLQWLDSATLALLEDSLTQPDLRHLLLIGAYRDNEVTANHPLLCTLRSIRSAGGIVRELVLGCLTHEDVSQLLSDSLHCDRWRAASLAQLLLAKTGGNPFFVIQFLTTLADEDLLSFDHEVRRWFWDVARIRAKGYTDNVVELMALKLTSLPARTRQALQQFACLGNRAELALLTIILEDSPQGLDRDLQEALRAGLVIQTGSSYRFLHDRVQEAAYSLIPEAKRAESHLRIGRLLALHVPPEAREEAIFEIVNQLNRGAALLSSQVEREQLAEFNLIAGKRAKSSTAYASALSYLAAGAALLSDDVCPRPSELMFGLDFQRAECEILTGELSVAERRLAALCGQAQNIVQSAAVAGARVDLYTHLERAERAAEVGLEFLGRVGVAWSSYPSDDEVDREYDRIWQNLGHRAVEELLELPPMNDVSCRVTLDVLTSLQAPAHLIGGNLLPLLVGRMANLSLEHGNAAGSCFAYVFLGIVLESRFGDYARGLRFGKLGLALLEKEGLDRFRARVYNNFAAAINPWANHARTTVDLLRHANDAARETSDVTFMGWTYTNLISARLIAGDALSEVQKEAETAIEYLQRARFGTAVDMVLAQLGLIRALRGLTRDLSTFSYLEFDETQYELHLGQDPGLAMPACWYWIRRMQACWFAGAHELAVVAATRAESLLWTSHTFIVMADYHFYAALAYLAQYEGESSERRRAVSTIVRRHLQMLEVWAEHCPDTFENRAALVSAELARIEGRPLDAEQLYEKASLSARRHGFVQNEAIANELAGHFYASRGLDRIATTYLRDAHACYLGWGAHGKARKLEQLYPQLRSDTPSSEPTTTIQAQVEHLDLATVIKVSEAVSGEIVLEKLIDTLMRMAIEHAGAERGLLILPQGDEHYIEAQITLGADKSNVEQRQASVTAADLPESVFRYVLRTKQSVVLHDAATQNPFSGDPYIREHRARSLLCLPILKQTRLLGLLYLENELTAGVFTPARMAIIKLLASEAASSLENARLYRDLCEREARIRRLVDANIIGILICDTDGLITEANDAFLRLVGYERADVVSQRMRWTDLTPSEFRARDEHQLVPELKTTGRLQPFQKEFFRKDGSRVPVLIGVANFEEGGGQGVAFVLDLTELKSAEAALRRAHDSLADAQRLSKTGSFTSDLLGDDHDWSEETFRIFEVATSSKVTLQMVRDRIHPSDLASFNAEVLRGSSGGDVEFAFRIVTSSGTVKHLRGGARVIGQEEGRPKLICTVQDVTESVLAGEALNKARSELARVSRVTTLGTLTASIAHEINQPLSGIITNASTCLRMLDSATPNVDGARETARRSIRDGNRAAAVIARLRTLFSKKAFTPEALDLNEAAREVIALSLDELQRDRVVVHSELAHDLPRITADRIGIQQVLLNLIRNASEAMAGVDERPRELSIRTEREGEDRVRVTVRDCGVGIDAEGIDKLFDAFYTTKNEGMGIGLSISRSIIEHHHGRLWATANEGPGASFAFSVPVQPNAD